MKTTWNQFQIAAFVCWAVGAVLIVAPCWKIYHSYNDPYGQLDVSGTLVGTLLVGVVLLATGGTLHKVGERREIKEKG